MLKRLLLSLATAVAVVLAFGTASALACSSLGVDKPEAHTGETVNFTLSSCQVDDNWELAVFYESPDSQDQTPEQRTLASGIADDTTITGDFTLPAEIGDTEQDVTLKLFVTRGDQQLSPLPLEMRYLGPVPTGGDTGPSGSTGSTTTGATPPPAIENTTPLPKTITRKQVHKKAKAKAKAKAKSKAKSKTPAKTKTKKKSVPVTRLAPVATAPAVTSPAAPVGGSFRPGTLPKPTTTPPPGLGGPPPANGTPPGGAPIAPAGSPVTPIAPTASTGKDDNPLGAPVWLVVVLGLLTLLGLGGAQTRMLGFWGPLPLIGRDPRDARLLALQRVAESGAASQKRIAQLKRRAGKDRTPVG